MNILFLHQNFPAQFVHLAKVLAQDPSNRAVFGTNRQQGHLDQYDLYQLLPQHIRWIKGEEPTAMKMHRNQPKGFAKSHARLMSKKAA